MKGRTSTKPIAYTPFGTFLTVLDKLKEVRRGTVVDQPRCNIREASWDQLRRALRAFQLVDEEDRATVALTRLNKNRKSELLKLLKLHYPEVFEIDLNLLGRRKLEKLLTAEYGVTGTTVGKARRFLLGALRYCDVDVSPELSRMTRYRAGKNPTVQIHPSSSSSDTILSRTEDGATITVAIQAGTWPEIEMAQGVLIDRLVDELKSFKRSTTKTRRPHLTIVKS